MNIIKNIRTLEGMAKQGLIKLHNQTGIKIKGLYGGKSFTCCYVDDRCEGVPSTFLYKGNWYELKYVSGCFMPYVVGIAPPQWINNWQKGFATLKDFTNYFSGKNLQVSK